MKTSSIISSGIVTGTDVVNNGCQLAVQSNGRANKLETNDRAFHDWYRFVLSYPPHLVRHYIQNFGLKSDATVLDPFCGTGTTLVEAKLAGVKAVGFEANQLLHFVTQVKLDWDIDQETFLKQAYTIASEALNILKAQGIDDDDPNLGKRKNIALKALDADATSLLLKNSISPLPLHKTLVLLDCLNQHKSKEYYNHACLALANAVVFKISNLHFGPEVGVRNIKRNSPVISHWLANVVKIVDDLRGVKRDTCQSAMVYLQDSRELKHIKPASIDAVVTSPPYPNEKDYTRTTRLEAVLLGFIRNKEELRRLKKQLIRSNTRSVYKTDDDDKWILNHAEILQIADDIEKRRIELNKDSGFERMYGRVTKLYFGGMARHLAGMRAILRPGAQLAYVVGDQASYLRVKIQTGRLLAEIAGKLGYDLVRIDLFRTRLSTATREQLREEAVILRWNG